MNDLTTLQAGSAHCAAVGQPAIPPDGAEDEMGASARFELTISGMTCGHCVRAVQEALDLPGVEVGHVRIGHASLGFEPETVSPAAVIEAIREAGYQASFGSATQIRGGAKPAIGLPLAPASGSCCSSR